MKRTATLLLASLMLVTLLSACAGNQTPAENNSSSNTPAPNNSSQSEEPSSNGEWPTLRIAVSLDARMGDPAEMVWEQEYNKSVGVNVEYITLPNDSAVEKKNLMLASNDLPDIFMGLIGKMDIMMYKDQGTFIPVNDIVDTKMPLLKAIYDKYPEYRIQATTGDGNMYGFPRIEEMFGLILNQGIL